MHHVTYQPLASLSSQLARVAEHVKHPGSRSKDSQARAVNEVLPKSILLLWRKRVPVFLAQNRADTLENLRVDRHAPSKGIDGIERQPRPLQCFDHIRWHLRRSIV